MGVGTMKHYNDIEAEDLFDMAVEWMRSGNLEKAEEQLRRVIELNKNFIYAYVTLARAYGRGKKFSDAVHTLKHALRLDPEFDRLNYLMAKYAWRGGDVRGALAALDRAIESSDNPLYATVRDYMRTNVGVRTL
jgi:tetratricopeptide (TPR) repeat protein